LEKYVFNFTKNAYNLLFLEKYKNMALIGRLQEIQQIEDICSNDKPCFIALYGRRRVGKTFLIKEYFDYKFTFYATGLANADTKGQLTNFTNFINEHFSIAIKTPKNWLETFGILKKELSKIKGKKIVFLDELPWFDTKRSDFLTGLEWFWNSWASAQKNIKLFVCGSAASWMINTLLMNTGGLHNRVTHRMKILPFTLAETEQFFITKNIVIDRYQIIQLYMVLGGVPFYLDQVKKGESAHQCIERICFTESGLLKNEFVFIFKSLFKDSEKHALMLRAIFNLGKQATRDNIVQATNIESSGDFSVKLNELEESGFIKSYIPFGLNKSKKIYVVSDYFTLFHFKFIEKANSYEKGIWVNRITDSSVMAWAGISFEQVCFDHIQNIKRALGIDGIISESSPWLYKPLAKTNKGAQIDLIINRKDNVINICEIKYALNSFTITKSYDLNLRNKVATFKEQTKTKKAIFTTMITTYGLTKNEYARSAVQNEIVMDDLFRL
jgi:uncharacterized protein